MPKSFPFRLRKSFISLLALLAGLTIWFSFPYSAWAQEPAPSGAVAPAPVTTGEVSLKSYNIKAEITPPDTAGQPNGSARVDAVFRLRNNDPLKPADVQLFFPTQLEGFQFEPGNLASFSLDMANSPLSLTSVVTPTTGYTTSVSIPADTQIDLEMNYTQLLDAKPVQTLFLDVRPLAQWGKEAVESARIELFFRTADSQKSQVLAYQPPAFHFDGSGWRWDGLRFKPDKSFRFSFISPGAWSQLLAWQAETSVPESAPSAWLAIGQFYNALSDQIPESQAIWRSRAISALLQAEAADSKRTEPIQALTDIYRAAAMQAADPPDTGYLSMAAAEGEKLLRLNQDDQATQGWLSDCLWLLAEKQFERGDAEAALASLKRLAAVSPQNAGRYGLEELQQKALLSLVEEHLQAEDVSGALAAADGVENETLIKELGDMPLWAGQEADVQVNNAGVRLSLVLYPFPQPSNAHQAALDELVAAWQGNGGAASSQLQENIYKADAYWTCPSINDCLQIMSHIGQAVPAAPAWDALRSMLTFNNVRLISKEQLFYEDIEFSADTTAVSLMAEASNRAAELKQLESAASDPIVKRLAGKLAEIWLAAANRRQTHLSLDMDLPAGGKLLDSWLITPSDSAPIAATYRHYRLEAFLWLFIALAGSAAIIFWLLLLPRRRRR